jgi:hypothetical protein
MLTVACVRTGQKYSTEYVYRLRGAVKRHLKRPHRFVCLTDNPRDLPDVETIPVKDGLHGWWGKMQLFEPTWRLEQKVLYLDLDSVIVREISPLADIESDFATCANFTVIHQQRICIEGGPRPSWPCKYGSMCMVIGPKMNGHIWDKFNEDADGYRLRAGILGDQKIIEEIEPDADLLQPLLRDGFFLGYRDLQKYPFGPPKGAAVIVFAGKNKPHNTECEWARRAWLHQ